MGTPTTTAGQQFQTVEQQLVSQWSILRAEYKDSIIAKLQSKSRVNWNPKEAKPDMTLDWVAHHQKEWVAHVSSLLKHDYIAKERMSLYPVMETILKDLEELVVSGAQERLDASYYSVLIRLLRLVTSAAYYHQQSHHRESLAAEKQFEANIAHLTSDLANLKRVYARIPLQKAWEQHDREMAKINELREHLQTVKKFATVDPDAAEKASTIELQIRQLEKAKETVEREIVRLAPVCQKEISEAHIKLHVTQEWLSKASNELGTLRSSGGLQLPPDHLPLLLICGILHFLDAAYSEERQYVGTFGDSHLSRFIEDMARCQALTWLLNSVRKETLATLHVGLPFKLKDKSDGRCFHTTVNFQKADRLVLMFYPGFNETDPVRSKYSPPHLWIVIMPNGTPKQWDNPYGAQTSSPPPPPPPAPDSKQPMVNLAERRKVWDEAARQTQLRKQEDKSWQEKTMPLFEKWVTGSEYATLCDLFGADQAFRTQEPRWSVHEYSSDEKIAGRLRPAENFDGYPQVFARTGTLTQAVAKCRGQKSEGKTMKDLAELLNITEHEKLQDLRQMNGAIATHEGRYDIYNQVFNRARALMDHKSESDDLLPELMANMALRRG